MLRIVPEDVYSDTTIQRESIYSTYDVENEVDFLRRHSELPEARKAWYIEENLLKFASEFAAEVPVQRLPGVITHDGRFDIAGVDMVDMTAETSALAEAGPRERAEHSGLIRVVGLLQQGMSQSQSPESIRVAWSSPCKGADTNYSILFYFQVGSYDEGLGGHPVTQRILRYDEKYGNFARSKKIYSGVQSLANQPWTSHQFSTAEDFLNEPILFEGNEAIDNYVIEELCGIDPNALRFTQEFEQRVSQDLQPLIHGYVSLALSMAQGRLEVTPRRLQELEDGLGRIFYWSKQIADYMKSDRYSVAPTGMIVDVFDVKADDRYRAARDRGELTTDSGTSCPSVKSGSIYSMAEQQKKLCCTCPMCGRKVEAVIAHGKIRCPECRSEKRWKENTKDDNVIDFSRYATLNAAGSTGEQEDDGFISLAA